MSGPLAGVRVVELGGIGPGPHASMLLADLGADVVRIERPTGGLQIVPPGEVDWLLRGRRSVAADLKDAAGLALARRLIDAADVLIEGFRPGVAERLGLAPHDLAATNPRLVYARMTGWGQDGPLADVAGHDINYLALSGVLHTLGPDGDPPVVPLNLVGDFGGGSTYLVMGVLAALFERERSGLGQVIDAAIVDGVESLFQGVWALKGADQWTPERGANLIDGGAPFYRTYVCADVRYVAVGAIEPRFYAALLDGLELDPAALPDRQDRTTWPLLGAQFADVFAQRARDEWTARFVDTDACVTPVLTPAEAAQHPHLVGRGTLVEYGGVVQAAAAPRFSRTPSVAPVPPPTPGADTADVLRDWGADVVLTTEENGSDHAGF